MLDLAVSIINFKTKDLTSRCLESILNKRWNTNYQIWVVDNNSGDGSLEFLEKKFPKVNFLSSDKNLGFAGGHNLVLKKVQANYYLILNSDTEVLEGSIDNLFEFMERHEFGIGSCKLINSDKSLQPNGGDLPNLISVFVWLSGLDDLLLGIREFLPSFHRKFSSFYKGEKVMGWVGGTAMIIKKDVIDKVGLLDDNIFMYTEDVEYCLRASRKNIKTGWTDKASIQHLGGGSLDNPSLRQWVGEFKGLLYIYEKYYGLLSEVFLELLIYFFTTLRMLAFLLLGRWEVSKTYAKVLGSL